jgi:hypothetical protein
MRKALMSGLAAAGLFGITGSVVACDAQQDASADGATMAMSKGAPAVITCEGKSCNAKPETLPSKSKSAKAKAVAVACTGKDC